MAQALMLRGVSYVYCPGQQPLEALAEVDLDVEEGEFMALVGPSGCGKTTLLRLVAGLVSPTTGEIVLTGRRGGRVGFVFQSGALMPWRTVRENIRLPLEVGGRRPDDREQRIAELVELVGLAGFEGSYPRELSGGMKQRVALARVLADDPDLLLLDEPFASLDAFSRDRMNEELQRIWMARPMTVMMVTHSIQEATFLADKVVVLSHRPGRVRGIFDVPFPRPRSQVLRYDREFVELSERIRFAADGGASVDGPELTGAVAEFF